MLTTIESIVERLVAGYAPDRIILYGSHATGRARDDSDIDLLIVKDTPQRPIDRRVAVERLLADRGVPVDVTVYTPDEVRRLFAAGSPFIEGVMEHGRVLYMRKATAAWLDEAQDELESAAVLLEHEKFRAACLHSQQCAVFLNSVDRGRYATEEGALGHDVHLHPCEREAMRTPFGRPAVAMSTFSSPPPALDRVSAETAGRHTISIAPNRRRQGRI